MAVQVSIKELISELEAISDESQAYINIHTGEIVSFSTEDVDTIENEDWDWHTLSPMEVDFLTKVEAALNTADYLRLPDRFEINEYNIMQKFSYEYSNEKISNILSDKICGSGAFRRFKDAIYHFGIEDEWFQYLADAYKKIAIDWLEENGFGYIDDMNK